MLKAKTMNDSAALLLHSSQIERKTITALYIDSCDSQNTGEGKCSGIPGGVIEDLVLVKVYSKFTVKNGVSVALNAVELAAGEHTSKMNVLFVSTWASRFA